ncbi:TIGR01457 family HAD-type hydrolase [Saccharibacillus alkalitolerans]|uniref:Acid sugar phosphatase n=1 Tax=Saccharibacillus alkalitolerans TaxID=2705290 RepID=A0ABX0F269_9BACL|nr:TIGR01457 family HAD-type hydrolase [Saccharibacillus alkalitolerans]NGZ74488.1 TIGR01457 family HAD-type hydrolase [Saccharibacillus alkalitolerans]
MPSDDAFLIDLDGTLYHGERMVPGADKLIETLNERGIPFLFLTNNSSAAPEAVALRLNKMGIPARAEQVCTSSMAAAAYMAGRKPGASAAVFGEAGLKNAVEAAGLTLFDEADGTPDYVLQGIDRQFTYEKLARAGRLILAGAEFVLTNPDLLLPSESGLMPGAGTLGAALESMTGVKPAVIGKPSPVLMNFAFNLLGVGAAQVTVIGDNMMTDIKAGAESGCRSLLVLTEEGVTTPSNLERHKKLAGTEPDLVKANLHELREWVLHL